MGQPMRSFHSPAQIDPGLFSTTGKEPLFYRTASRRRSNVTASKKGGAQRPPFPSYFLPPLRLPRFSFMCSSDSLLSELAINCLS